MTNPDRSRLRLVPQNAPLDPPAGVPAEAPSKPGKRRRKHTDPRHRGVKLIPPDGAPGSAARRKQPYWRARYEDPELVGKPDGLGGFVPVVKFERLPPELQPGTIETRRDWAISKHDKLEGRRKEIAAGAQPHYSADDLLVDVFKLYFAGWGQQHRGITQTAYRHECDNFLAWCATPGVDLIRVRQLTKGILRTYAGTRVATPLDPACGRTGQRAKSTINRELRCLSAVLGELRAAEKIHLTRDDIAEGLAKLKESVNKRKFRRAAELRMILDACRRHDAMVPARGRRSHSAGRALPIVLFVLLTGMRIDEAVWIEWRDITLDDDGHPLITVRAEVSKTGVERVIDTGHSPLLAWIVSGFAGRSGRLLGVTEPSATTLRERLIDKHGAPDFTYQELRCTCGTYLTCAPAIWGDAAPFMSARQLGHSVTIAEKHYVGVVKVSHDAKTTEAAMQLGIDDVTTVTRL
jgi:integrase